MSAILTTNLLTQVAKSFLHSMAGANNFLYLFEGQSLPWPNDNIPPFPTESVFSYKTVWDNMLAAKLITVNNLSLVIKNETWQPGTVYNAYDDMSGTLFTDNKDFYVVTPNNEIYKCLSNNNSQASVISPIGTGNQSNNYIQTTDDGYMWKYMLNVQPNDPFVNSFWVPIPELAPPGSTQETIQTAAVAGSIDVIKVLDGGHNYANGGQQYIVTITGDGVGANAYANVQNGIVQNIVPVNRGQGYNFAQVTFSDPNGTGASARAIMPPTGGHGSDASSELGTKTVMISVAAANTESGYFTISNQFRQNGLVLNPLQFGANTVSSNVLVKVAETLTVTGGIGSYVVNETIFQGSSVGTSTFSGTVIDFDPVLSVLRLNNQVGSPQIGQILYGLSSGAQRYITNVLPPDIQRYTGKILTIDNEIPISRTGSETDRFQFAIQF